METAGTLEIDSRFFLTSAFCCTVSSRMGRAFGAAATGFRAGGGGWGAAAAAILTARVDAAAEALAARGEKEGAPTLEPVPAVAWGGWDEDEAAREEAEEEKELLVTEVTFVDGSRCSCAARCKYRADLERAEVECCGADVPCGVNLRRRRRVSKSK